ncbi:MAG TPA: hypothetical protein VGR87_14015 [Candidatus Limnocylindria bacterium]|nr:hypothetical protein [Candidatus Limnocylindria bacterium]
MEVLIVVGALVALDIAAYFFGADSRELVAPDQHDRAMVARRRGDLGYRAELTDFERHVRRTSAIRL